MTSATMITDDWERVHANNRIFEEVSWEQLEAAIRSMDGVRHTQVVVQYPDYSNLIVGGGPSVFNVVIATPDDRFSCCATLRPKKERSS